MVKGVDHVTINVKRLEESLKFYGELLGLKRLDDVDMGDHRLIYFQLAEGCRLELIQYNGETGEYEGKPTDRGMFRHLALEVTDLEEIWARLETCGGTVLQPPRWVEKLQFTGMLAADPNGCELEFVQRR